VHARQFDAAEEAAVREVVQDAVRRYGRLDVFFANAGQTGPVVNFSQIEPDEFMETFRVNSLSVFLAAKHAAPAMQLTSASKPAASGSIIATASVAGLRSNAGGTPYSASKAAVVSIAQTVAFQLAGTGVRINALCPGLIETGMTAPVFDAARARGTQGRIGQLNPLRRAGHADEIARVALFLGSDESSYVNGQAWAVDGGLSSGLPYVPGRLA
jgi:NAD(P)-dependent dehydrogenase (short-subunit alcohol dehydrogenase family)